MGIKTKQIDWLQDSLIVISGFAASGTSNNVTTAITTALSTAARGGGSVPLQVGSDTQVGVITTGKNTVSLFDASTLKSIKDASGNEVYARLTQASNVYTLTYYSNVNGTETAFTFPSTSINFWFSYRFDAYRLPPDFAISYTVGNNNEAIPISGGTNQKTYYEALTITGAISSGSTLPDLTKTPISANAINLKVNGLSYFSAFSHFTLSGKTITWTNSQHGIATTDQVMAIYETTE